MFHKKCHKFDKKTHCDQMPDTQRHTIEGPKAMQPILYRRLRVTPTRKQETVSFRLVSSCRASSSGQPLSHHLIMHRVVILDGAAKKAQLVSVAYKV